jgi:hypothetical protein
MKNKTKVVIASGIFTCLLAAGAVAVALFSQPASAALPGFALVSDRNEEHVFVSPEGFYCRFHEEENYPKKGVRFWRDALANKMNAAGYTPLFEERLAAGGPGACYCEWGAPLGSQDYVYATVLSVKGDRLFIGEAAGEISLFAKYRQPIIDSVREVIRSRP